MFPSHESVWTSSACSTCSVSEVYLTVCVWGVALSISSKEPRTGLFAGVLKLSMHLEHVKKSAFLMTCRGKHPWEEFSSKHIIKDIWFCSWMMILFSAVFMIIFIIVLIHLQYPILSSKCLESFIFWSLNCFLIWCVYILLELTNIQG